MIMMFYRSFFTQPVKCYLLYFMDNLYQQAHDDGDNAPGEHDTLAQCWFNVGHYSMSLILAQHVSSIGRCILFAVNASPPLMSPLLGTDVSGTLTGR